MKGAIFDLDGTLLDSMRIWENLGEYYLQGKGIVPEAGLYQLLSTMSLSQAAAYFRSHYGVIDSEARILSDINEIIAVFYQEQAELKPGVFAFVDELYKNGVVMCIATACDLSLIHISPRSP